MTASDPAVAAAFRVAEDWVGRYDIGVGVAAAREALAPLRELHKPVTEPKSHHFHVDDRSELFTYCSHCGVFIGWPCATAKLVYPEEQL